MPCLLIREGRAGEVVRGVLLLAIESNIFTVTIAIIRIEIVVTRMTVILVKIYVIDLAAAEATRAKVPVTIAAEVEAEAGAVPATDLHHPSHRATMRVGAAVGAAVIQTVLNLVRLHVLARDHILVLRHHILPLGITAKRRGKRTTRLWINIS